MWLIDQLAEWKIAEAIKKGELSNLPGEGRPLQLDDDSLVPEELRAGYRLLKNAGYLPPELVLRKEISSVDALLVQACGQEERAALSKRRNYLLIQLSETSPRSLLLTDPDYSEKFRHRSGA